MDIEKLIGTGWLILGALFAGVVWLVRLEGRVNLLFEKHKAMDDATRDWREAQRREVDAVAARTGDHVTTMERDIERLDSSLDNVRERMRGVERALNGKLQPEPHPWDRETERRRGQ